MPMLYNSQCQYFNLHLIRLATGVADELIASAQKAQPHWKALFEGQSAEIQRLIKVSRQGVTIWDSPLFLEFLLTWTGGFNWPIVESFSHGVNLRVPDVLVKPLVESGMIESFDLYMMDRATFCSATLGSNDHNQEFALMINAPAWLQLASMPEHFECFCRQLRMVIHHEMAHFRYKKANLRTEQIAHCRGIASLIPIAQFPKNADDLLTTLTHLFPEVLANDECKQLLSERPDAAARLIRIWSQLNADAFAVS
jgi:hypothetical protein